MGRKNAEVYPLSIVGLIFTVNGSLFFLLGLFLLVTPQDAEARTVGQIYLPLGLVFLILGVTFLYIRHRQKQEQAQLIAAGRYIWGEIAELTRNTRVRINGRNPYALLVHYRMPDGTLHVFRSCNIMTRRDQRIIGKMVKVYVSDNTFSKYYVDVLPALSQVIEH